MKQVDRGREPVERIRFFFDVESFYGTWWLVLLDQILTDRFDWSASCRRRRSNSQTWTAA